MGGCCCDVGSVVMYLSISGHLISLLPGPAQLSVHPFLSFSSSSRTIWWGNRGSLSVPREDRRGLLCVFSHRLQLIRLVTAGYRWDMLYCTVLYCTVLYWLSVRYALNTTQYFYSIQVQWWRWQIMCRIHLVVVQCQRDMMVLLSDVTRCLSPGHQGVKVWCSQVAVGSRSSALP